MENKNNNEEKPKKSWLKALSGLVYEGEDTTNTADAVTTLPEGSGGQSKFSYSDVTPASNMPAGVVVPNQGGVFDEKFYNSFLKLIETNNIDGVDYFEFSRAKKANENMPGFTEAMKYQIAFNSVNTFSSEPITKEHLIKTADFYIDKLNQEEIEFNNEMQHEVESQVNSKLNQSKSKQDDITSKQEQIVKLQAEINSLQGEIGALNVEAQQIQSKIEATAKNFKVSLEVVKTQINVDKQNISTFIQ
jgi:hypothetical protein